MTRRTCLVYPSLFLLLTFGCEDSTKARGDRNFADTGEWSDGQDASTGEEDVGGDAGGEELADSGGELPDAGEEEVIVFDPDNPGYNVQFAFVDMAMMGEINSFIIGYIMETAREDTVGDEEAAAQPIGTCVLGESAPRVRQCITDEDCAPEQECRPETDDDGNPIVNSQRCITPNRESLNVGPIVISGFQDGPQTFLYEPGDQVYKLNGQGDGSVDPSLITYNMDYTLTAENPTPEDLDSFSGSFHLGSRFELTSHEIDMSGMFPAIVIDTSSPLTFTWTPSGHGGTVELTISAMASMMSMVSVSCLVEDNGEFTIPEDLAAQLVIGTDMFTSMGNMLTMRRNSETTIAGGNISASKISSDQLVISLITAR